MLLAVVAEAAAWLLCAGVLGRHLAERPCRPIPAGMPLLWLLQVWALLAGTLLERQSVFMFLPGPARRKRFSASPCWRACRCFGCCRVRPCRHSVLGAIRIDARCLWAGSWLRLSLQSRAAQYRAAMAAAGHSLVPTLFLGRLYPALKTWATNMAISWQTAPAGPPV